MQLYNAVVEVTYKGKIEDAADVLITALEGYSPATSRSLLGRLEVIISVPAESLRQAVTTALALVETAAARPALSVEVLLTDDFDRLNGLEPVPQLVSVTEAAGILGVSRQRVHELVETGMLPAQKVGNAVVLHRAAVEARAARAAELERVRDEIVADLPDVLAGTGAHAEHTQQRTDRVIRCSCGIVVGLTPSAAGE